MELIKHPHLFFPSQNSCKQFVSHSVEGHVVTTAVVVLVVDLVLILVLVLVLVLVVVLVLTL